ncbi:MAG TPA: hypothetical protein DCS37_00760, partial [Clostridiales bacterium]|nr:hypothetical protein [Clostridiales bacterium]
MNDKQIENAIKKGIESKGAIEVGEEIAKAILVGSQNDDFIEQKTQDEMPVAQIEIKTQTNQTAQGDSAESADKQDK